MSRETGQSYQFGPFRLDLSEHMLLRDGQPVPLTPKIFDVLGVLVRHSGHLVNKETLLREVWPGSFVEEGALNRTVSVLRKALGESPSGQKYIETVPKRGYRFVAPVTESPDDSSRSVVDPHSRAVIDIEANDTRSVDLSNTAQARPTRTTHVTASGSYRRCASASDCCCAVVCDSGTRRAEDECVADACSGAPTGHLHRERGHSHDLPGRQAHRLCVG